MRGAPDDLHGNVGEEAGDDSWRADREGGQQSLPKFGGAVAMFRRHLMEQVGHQNAVAEDLLELEKDVDLERLIRAGRPCGEEGVTIVFVFALMCERVRLRWRVRLRVRELVRDEPNTHESGPSQFQTCRRNRMMSESVLMAFTSFGSLSMPYFHTGLVVVAVVVARVPGSSRCLLGPQKGLALRRATSS